MKKQSKVALLITIWSIDFLKDILNGIQEELEGHDIHLDVYVGFDIDEWQGMTFKKEREFFSLVNPEEYDGALIAIGAYNYLEAVQKAAKRFMDAGVPVISIDSPIEDAPVVKVDNYSAFYEITEHILKEHKCKIINYVGGPEGAPDAVLRRHAFEDCCRDYDIDPKNIHEKAYAYAFDDGKQAYRDFKAEGFSIPEAVICANDGMARGYCEAALEDGFKAPTDFLITGFDNDIAARNYTPSITTVDPNTVESARIAMNVMLRRLEGEEVPMVTHIRAKLIPAQSCGCGAINRSSEEKILILHKFQEAYDNRALRNRLALQCISDSADIVALQQNLNTYCDLVNSERVAICLNSSLLNRNTGDSYDGFDDEMIMVTKSGVFKIDRSEGINPSYTDVGNTSRIMLICPLYYDRTTFGYVCFAYSDALVEIIDRRAVAGYLSVAIASLKQKIALKYMNEEIEKMNRILKDLSVTDSLTGLNNRLAYSQMGKDFYEAHKGNVYFLYIDMDKLKYINDTLGHDAGNVAIIGIAEGIKKVFPQNDLKFRMGGDEFLVIGMLDSKEALEGRIKELEVNLIHCGLENNMPIPLTASMGYVLGASGDEYDDFETMVRRADTRMYEVKQAKKRI